IRLWLVPNGKDALAFLRKEGTYAHAPFPALIILDINLPYLNGRDVLVQLRRLPVYKTTPVVMFSSASGDIEEARCLELGADQYVQKPADPAPFFAAAQTLVKTWRLAEGTGKTS